MHDRLISTSPIFFSSSSLVPARPAPLFPLHIDSTFVSPLSHLSHDGSTTTHITILYTESYCLVVISLIYKQHQSILNLNTQQIRGAFFLFEQETLSRLPSLSQPTDTHSTHTGRWVNITMRLLTIAPLLLFVAFISTSTCAETSVLSLDLAGSGWTLSNEVGNVTGVPATVPGQVHVDLMRAGIIKDPYQYTRDLEYLWIPAQTWIYRKKFSLPTNMTSKSAFSLVLEGLDTVAEVYLDGVKVGSYRNMFREYREDVTSLLSDSTGRPSFDINLMTTT